MGSGVTSNREEDVPFPTQTLLRTPSSSSTLGNEGNQRRQPSSHRRKSDESLFLQDFSSHSSGPSIDRNETEYKTSRKLKARHLEMIAIGGTIGTGLFVASGESIATAGPLGAVCAYLIVGIMVYFVVTSLGEMATFIPVSGSFNSYAGRYLDPAIGFSMGWNYWLAWAVSLPAELSAAGIVMQFWFPNIDTWIWSLGMISILFIINLNGVASFGEIEFWLSIIKVIAVVVFIILGILIDSGGIPGRKAIGFENYQIEGAPFNNGIPGLFTVFTSAFFAYGGTELVGITAGEAQNPRVSVPKAINGTFWRICIFYTAAIFIMGLIIPNNDPHLTSSGDISVAPFTRALELSNIPAAASIMNAVILIAIISAANSSMYAASRTLMAMAQEGKAPSVFKKTSKNGVPLASLIVTTLFGMVAFLGTMFGNGVVFNWLLSVSGASALMSWLTISVVHLRFRQAYIAQGFHVEDLPYRAPFYPYGQYISIILGILVLVGEGYVAIFMKQPFDWINVVACYVGIPFYIFLYAIYKWVTKCTVVPLLECDLQTGNIFEQEMEESRFVDTSAYELLDQRGEIAGLDKHDRMTACKS